MKFTDLLKPNNRLPQSSFLLGMIYARPIILNGSILAYSSYRKGPVSQEMTTKPIEKYYQEHIEKLKSFLGPDYEIVLNNNLPKGDRDGKERIQPGVSVLIENDLALPGNIDLKVYIYGLIEKWLIDASEESKKLFLIGTMDSRGSLDFTARYISLDIIEENFILVKRKLAKYNDIIGAVFNYNPRLMQENSSKKNDQFRLPLFYYMGNFGLFNPFKIDYYKTSRGLSENTDLSTKPFFIDSEFKDDPIPEKFISERNLKINNLAIKLHDDNLTEKEKVKMVELWKAENMSIDTDEEIMYSSQNMKEFSKKESNYLCEFDNTHITFNAKANNKNYVEAHHLIPFSERGHFPVSIDVVENIACLCPNCHRKIHLAVDSERRDFIESLFKSRKEKYKKIGINIDLDGLLRLYKVG